MCEQSFRRNAQFTYFDDFGIVIISTAREGEKRNWHRTSIPCQHTMQSNLSLFIPSSGKFFHFHQNQLIQHQKNIPHIHIFNPITLGCSRTRWKMREVYFIIRRVKRAPTQSYEQIEKRRKEPLCIQNQKIQFFHIFAKFSA